MIRELNYRVVEICGDDRIVHIENISNEMARIFAEIFNEKYDFSFVVIEEMEDETTKD